MPPVTTALAFAVVTVAATVQGSVGFGMGLLAAPFLIQLDPALVPGPLMAAGLVLTVMLSRREWGNVNLPAVAWILAGRLPGTLAAAGIFLALPDSAFPLLFSILLLFAVGLSACGLRLPITRISQLSAGFLSGLMATLCSVGGPPVALLFQDTHGPELRGTMSGYFVIGSTFTLMALMAVGRYGQKEMWLSVPLAAAVISGYCLSSWTAPYLDAGRTRAAVLALSTVGGVLALTQALSI